MFSTKSGRVNQGVIVIAVIMILLIVGGGYYVFNKKATNDEAMTDETKSLSDGDDDKMEVGDLLSGFLQQDYRVTIKTEGVPGGQMGDIVVEYDAPDKTRTVMTSAQGTVETIVTSDANFTRIGDGKWAKSDGGNASSSGIVGYSKEKLEEMTNTPGVTLMGKKPCSAGVCDVYSGTFEGATAATVYIDALKKRPVRIEAEMTGGQKTVMDYDYTGITIVVPTEASEMPDFSSGNLSPEDLEKLQNTYGNL